MAVLIRIAGGVFLVACALLLAPAPTYASVELGNADLNTLSNGLVGYWSMDGNTINWNTGTITDLSGNGNTGTLTGMSTTTSPVPGKIGSALKFNGTSSYINTGNAASLNMAGSMAICAWFKATNASLAQRIVSKVGPSGNRAYLMDLNGSNLRIEIATTATTLVIASGATTLSNNVWYFGCGIYNAAAGTVAVYLNGNQDGITTGVANSQYTSNGFPVYIGVNDSAGFGVYFSGTIDDVRIYNRALSSQEVSLLYALGEFNIGYSPVPTSATSGTGLNSGLVGYWTFDGSSLNWRTDTAADSSGNGNTGTLVNMSTTTSPVPGKIGGALKFNGTNTSISVPNLKTQFSNSVSVSAWVQAVTTSNNFPAIFVGATSNSPGQAGFVLRLNGLTGSPQFLADTGSRPEAQGATDIFGTGWHLLVGTYNGSVIDMYQDGQLVGSTLTSGNIDFGSGTTAWAIGAPAPGTLDTNWNGTIDDVRVYNRALSAQEVAQLYALGDVHIDESNNVTLSNGLVGHWPLNGPATNWKTDTTADTSSSGNTGALVGMSTTSSPVAGKIGGALNFNGSTQYVNAGAKQWPQTGFSISAWIKPASISSNAVIASVYNGPSSTGTGYMQFGVNAGGIISGRIHQTGSIFIGRDSGAIVTTSAWQHVVFTWNGGTTDASIAVYLNGKEVDATNDSSGTFSGPYSGTSVPFIIGGQYVSSVLNAPFIGAIDDVRIYNRALSPQEVQQLYLLGK